MINLENCAQREQINCGCQDDTSSIETSNFDWCFRQIEHVLLSHAHPSRAILNAIQQKALTLNSKDTLALKGRACDIAKYLIEQIGQSEKELMRDAQKNVEKLGLILLGFSLINLTGATCAPYVNPRLRRISFVIVLISHSIFFFFLGKYCYIASKYFNHRAMGHMSGGEEMFEVNHKCLLLYSAIIQGETEIRDRIIEEIQAR